MPPPMVVGCLVDKYQLLAGEAGKHGGRAGPRARGCLHSCLPGWKPRVPRCWGACVVHVQGWLPALERTEGRSPARALLTMPAAPPPHTAEPCQAEFNRFARQALWSYRRASGMTAVCDADVQVGSRVRGRAGRQAGGEAAPACGRERAAARACIAGRGGVKSLAEAPTLTPPLLLSRRRAARQLPSGAARCRQAWSAF
jgi:hypothetical protein